MNFSDIKPYEIVKVLTVDGDDEVEEEYWAKVMSNEGSYLFVSYLSFTDKIYKGATIHSLDSTVSRVDPESVTEHHADVVDLADVGFYKVDANMYALTEDIDDSDDDSDIYEDDDESCDEYDTTDGFVVDDQTIDGPVHPPPDAALVDSDWDKWAPATDGERRYKDMVDRIEKLAKAHADNLNF